MIKFFRHIRKTIIMKNQRGKYLKYAIGEIVLVVIGILIALSINTWNEDRKDRIAENELLKNLKSEYLINLQQLNNKLAGSEYDLHLTDSLILRMNKNVPIQSEESFVILLGDISNPPSFDPNTGVMDDIISTGKLALIRDNSLHQLITSWSGLLAESREIEQVLREKSRRQFIPFISEYIPIRLLYKKQFGASRFTWNSADLMNNKLLENHLVDFHRMHTVLIPRYKKLKENLENTVQLINKKELQEND